MKTKAFHYLTPTPQFHLAWSTNLLFFFAPEVGKKKIAKDLEVYPWNSLAAKPTNLEHVPSLCVRKASPALVYQARTI